MREDVYNFLTGMLSFVVVVFAWSMTVIIENIWPLSIVPMYLMFMVVREHNKLGRPKSAKVVIFGIVFSANVIATCFFYQPIGIAIGCGALLLALLYWRHLRKTNE